ncbi:MAG: tetratricopeptide repeat protein [Holophagales bacterium]|nr:tetratricopeptide repeat protein [Holophagales bacterium]
MLRLLLASALLSSPFLLAQQPEKVSQKSPETTPGKTPAASRLQDENPVWASTFDEAVKRAKSTPEGRVFVELRDADCPECVRMEKLIYPSASFRSFMRDKVPVVVDRAGPEGQRLSKRFGIRRAPAWLVVTPDLLLAGRQEGGSSQAAWMESFVNSEKAWAEYRGKLDAEKKAPSDPAAAFAVGEEAFRRVGDAMAEERFRRVTADAKASPQLREKSLAYLAAIALEAQRFDDAEKALKQLLATTKDPALLEQAELRLADVEIGRGQKPKAIARLKTFLEKHPQSPMRKDAEALLEALSPSKK